MLNSRALIFMGNLILLIAPLPATALTPGPTDPGQCPTYWQISNERAETFKRTYQAVSDQTNANYRQCSQYGSMTKERFACDGRAHEWYEANNAKAKAEYERAKAAYEQRRDQCLGIANQNKAELEARDRVAETQRRLNEQAERQQEQLRTEAFNAEMRRGQAERDAWNRAAEERNRQAQQQYQAQQQAQRQTAIARQAEEQRQAQIRAEQAARQAKAEAEQQQAIHDLRMGLLEKSGREAQERLDSARENHEAVAAANTDEESMLTAMLAKMEAAPRAVREVKADIANSPLGQAVGTLQDLGESSGGDSGTADAPDRIEYRRADDEPARSTATPAASGSVRLSGGDESAASTCRINTEPLGQPPADASITAHTETLMYRLDQALARLESECAGSPDYARTRSELTEARKTAEDTCNAVQSGGRRCAPARHF
ncbi:MAG TPA: hypothetical protein VFW49_11410 [Fluviicoccus sp.]|nr:hypothetical protein [Fluviicoccus sp.]